VGTSQVRKPAVGSRAGTNARPADEGYLYVAGVRDASQRVSEYRVCPPSSFTIYLHSIIHAYRTMVPLTP